jgi:hypothetical protein
MRQVPSASLRSNVHLRDAAHRLQPLVSRRWGPRSTHARRCRGRSRCNSQATPFAMRDRRTRVTAHFDRATATPIEPQWHPTGCMPLRIDSARLVSRPIDRGELPSSATKRVPKALRSPRLAPDRGLRQAQAVPSLSRGGLPIRAREPEEREVKQPVPFATVWMPPEQPLTEWMASYRVSKAGVSPAPAAPHRTLMSRACPASQAAGSRPLAARPFLAPILSAPPIALVWFLGVPLRVARRCQSSHESAAKMLMPAPHRTLRAPAMRHGLRLRVGSD